MRLARNTRVFICALGIMVALPTRLAAQAAVPRARIDTAVAIRVARATYQEVQRALGAHRLSRRDTTVTCHDEEPGLALMFHRDIIGVVRHFEWRGGSEDHAVRNQYLYDAAGRQRFAFVTLGAVSGTEYEERVYFGDHGEVVRRLKRLVKGPGFPVQDEQGIRDPLMWIQTICK
jgi:hypothetical protein